MAESDFNDLLNAAEHLASEVDGNGELPRVERTLRQVLEASQDLWSRVTTSGAQEIQANLLLGSKGVDLPQLSQKLESLSTKKTFEPLDPIPITDIENFLKNETENAILSLIDSTHTDTFQRLKKEHESDVEYEWELEKMKLMSSMLGKVGQENPEVSLVHERTVLNESVMPKSLLNPKEMRYARAVMNYHKSMMDGITAIPNLIDMFSEVAISCNDQMANEIWPIVKVMTQIPPQGKGDAMIARNVPVVKMKMVSQARSYLENRYRLYMNSVVQSNIKDVQRGGEPGTLALVRSFVSIRMPQECNPVKSEVRIQWPLVYYCIRCGDILSALKCIQIANFSSQCEEIRKALEEMKDSPDRKISLGVVSSIRRQYKRAVRHELDPYKRVIYCMFGSCDVNDEHSEIIKTTDDYLWLKLNQVCETEEHNKTEGFESISYSLLQTLIIEEYGERHYNANEQPHIYFQLLFLTGQWEAAIDFLMRNDKLQVHGVHIAIILQELGLLALPDDVKSQLLVVNLKDPKPMHRLNFARLIMMYVHRFENQDLFEAIHYYFCLRNLQTTTSDNMFAVCVTDLAMRTKEFEKVLGSLEVDGCRLPGLIDHFRSNRVDVDIVVYRVAQSAEVAGLYEDAIKLYDLAGKHDDVLRLMSTLLCQVVARVDSEPGSLRSRLAKLADNITTRYAGISLKCDRATLATFYTLRDLLKFFDYYAEKLYPEALDTIQRSRLIPFSLDEVDDKIKTFRTLNETICRNIPDIVLATMNMLYAQYTKIKRDAQNVTKTYFGNSSKEQLSFLRERAKAITSFAGTVPYRMPGDTNTRLVQMEILMH